MFGPTPYISPVSPAQRGILGKHGRYPSLGVALAALLATAPACSGPTSPAPTPRSTSLEPDRLRAERGVGLDVSTLVLRDDGDRVVSALLPFDAAPTGLDDATRDAWRRTGLRVVAVPADRLASVLAPLSLAGADSEGAPLTAVSVSAQRSLALDGRWAELLKEPGPARARTLLISDRRLRLETGSARLLARAWPEPAPGAGGVRAAVRLELVPQWLDAAHPADGQAPVDDELLAGRLRGASELGQVFSRLRGRVTLDGSVALVLLQDAPAADWAALSGPRPVEGTGPDATDPAIHAARGLSRGTVKRTDSARGVVEEPPASASDRLAGPAATAFRAVTLGELLLAGPDDGAAYTDRPAPGPRVRQVVVLLPRAGGAYRLLDAPVAP